MKFIFFTSHLKFCSSIYLRSDVPVFVSVSSKTAPSTVMCVTSVWTNGWRGDILVEKNSGHDGCCICIYIPYKFALSSCIPSKIKCEILAHKGLQTIHAMPGDYLACKPMGQPDLLVSMMMNQDFPGKVTHCRKVFFIPIAQRSIEEDDAIISKLTKGKDKTCGQSGKTTKCAEEQNNELTESIRN